MGYEMLSIRDRILGVRSHCYSGLLATYLLDQRNAIEHLPAFLDH